MHIAQAISGLHPNVRTPFHISGTAGRIALEFGERLETPQLCFMEIKGGVHLHVRTCIPNFCISQTCGCIVVKFSVWLGTS